jgi:hypothetical protein
LTVLEAVCFKPDSFLKPYPQGNHVMKILAVAILIAAAISTAAAQPANNTPEQQIQTLISYFGNPTG